MEEGEGGGSISQCIKVLYKRVNLQKSKKSSDSDYFVCYEKRKMCRLSDLRERTRVAILNAIYIYKLYIPNASGTSCLNTFCSTYVRRIP